MSQKGNQRYRCQVCELFYDSSREKVFMAYFPKNVARCKAWLKVTGKEKLLSLPLSKLIRKRVCYLHFTPQDYSICKVRLKKSAVPSVNLTRPPLPDQLVEIFPVSEIELTKRILTAEKVVQYIQHDHKYFYIGPPKYIDFESSNEEPSNTMNLGEDTFDNNSVRNGVVCTDVEYLEDAVSDCANDGDDIPSSDKQYLYPELDETTIFKKEITLSLDYIDYLFLSYAQTFRSLAKQFQTMLKLDIAKLFARYEMKNISLVTQEPEKRPLTPENPEHISDPLVNKPPPQADKPLSPVAKQLDEHVIIPLQVVDSDTHKPEPAKSCPKVIQNSQDVTKKPCQIKEMPPQTLRYRPQVVSERNLILQPQSTQSKGLKMKTKQKTDTFESLHTNFDETNPTVKLEKLMTNIPIPDSTLLPPPNKMMKYYVPKRGPAYAIMNKEELENTEEGTGEPDLEMEVSEPLHTETVFVTTNPVSFSEDET